MDRIMLKMLLALAFFIATLLIGLAPIKLLNAIIERQRNGGGVRASFALSLLSCFSGGVFLGTCLLDIFPDIRENYDEFHKAVGWSTEYPIPWFLVGCGFFLVYMLEELTLNLFASSGHHHNHHQQQHAANINRELELEAGTSDGHIGTKAIEVHKSETTSLDHAHTDDGALRQKNATKAQEIIQRNSTGSSDDDSGLSLHTICCENHVMKGSPPLTCPFEPPAKLSSSAASPVAVASAGSLLKSLTFTVAISFHSVLDGFVMGVQRDNTGVMTLFVSLLIHKAVEAFSVGLQVSRANAGGGRGRVLVATATILVYALMTPLGTLIGVLITSVEINELWRNGIVLVLECLAGGTFIYVTLFEIIAEEKANEHSNFAQLADYWGEHIRRTVALLVFSIVCMIANLFFLYMLRAKSVPPIYTQEIERVFLFFAAMLFFTAAVVACAKITSELIIFDAITPIALILVLQSALYVCELVLMFHEEDDRRNAPQKATYYRHRPPSTPSLSALKHVVVATTSSSAASADRQLPPLPLRRPRDPRIVWTSLDVADSAGAKGGVLRRLRINHHSNAIAPAMFTRSLPAVLHM